MLNPVAWRGTCVNCKQEVTYEKGFQCSVAPGNHKLESRTYYHMGGNHLPNERERRTWAPQVCLNAPSDRLDKHSGKVVSVQPLMVQFQNGGLYTTDDAEQQFYLETTKPAVGWGEAGAARWNQTYLTKSQRVDLKEAELAERERKIKETNDLLTQTQARVRGGTKGSV